MEKFSRGEYDLTQHEQWLKKYREVKDFIETNHRNPSRHNHEERFKYLNWLKHNKKLLNAGEMKEERVGLFCELVDGVVTRVGREGRRWGGWCRG